MQDSEQAYKALISHLELQPQDKVLPLERYSEGRTMLESARDDRLAMAVRVLLGLMNDDECLSPQVDRLLLDRYIGRIDQLLSQYLDYILHDAAFQKLESTWRSIWHLLSKQGSDGNCQLSIMNTTKEQLKEDFVESSSVMESALYKRVYTEEYDTPGGEPYAAIALLMDFSAQQEDIALLRSLTQVAAAAHCPVLADVGPQFFNKPSFASVSEIEDIETHFERAEYIAWQQFRRESDTRYLGLFMPKFMLRLPYGDEHPIRQFYYQESVSGSDDFVWGAGMIPFVGNMMRSFQQYGWSLNVRGPESGGRVENLPLHQIRFGRVTRTTIPTQISIPETRELALAKQGLITLSYYKNSNYACFFSANSVHHPDLYLDEGANANARINARLPYLFLSTRIAHYLKVIQREAIGSNKGRHTLEQELNHWLKTLVTKMHSPTPDIIARHPLKDAGVMVSEKSDNPGYYTVDFYAVPHFQVEGMDVRLTLLAKMPKQ